ncbi:hypothetical protein PV783_13730 [Chitinophaga sp. CC14]|uniref:hypothetical protein n=1 Tax=Chitinophaga sp. CC14 TaxID=3029199 RepID=UPI003B76CF40
MTYLSHQVKMAGHYGGFDNTMYAEQTYFNSLEQALYYILQEACLTRLAYGAGQDPDTPILDQISVNGSKQENPLIFLESKVPLTGKMPEETPGIYIKTTLGSIQDLGASLDLDFTAFKSYNPKKSSLLIARYNSSQIPDTVFDPALNGLNSLLHQKIHGHFEPGFKLSMRESNLDESCIFLRNYFYPDLAASLGHLLKENILAMDYDIALNNQNSRWLIDANISGSNNDLLLRLIHVDKPGDKQSNQLPGIYLYTTMTAQEFEGLTAVPMPESFQELEGYKWVKVGFYNSSFTTMHIQEPFKGAFDHHPNLQKGSQNPSRKHNQKTRQNPGPSDNSIQM